MKLFDLLILTRETLVLNSFTFNYEITSFAFKIMISLFYNLVFLKKNQVLEDLD